MAATLGAFAILSGALAVATPRPTAALSLLAVPDTLTTVHDRTRTVAAPGVLTNDVIVLGTTAVFDSQPTNGSVSLASNGGYTYDPDPGFVGTDVFRYHDFDGLLPTNSTTVTITVRNSAPIAEDDEESANAGRRETVEAPGVLENDEDPDDDPLQAKLVSGPAHGTLSFHANGGFEYTAEPGFDGDDVFTYVATDGIADSAVTEVVMNVSASGSTPKPSVGPTPQPTAAPTPAPTPTRPPTPGPTPSPTPAPTGPGSVDPTPAPSAGASPRPGTSARPSTSPTFDPGASPTPAPPDASDAPRSGAIVPGGPGDPAGGAGGGGPGAGSGGAGPGGSGGSSTGGGTDADGPTFSIGGDGPVPEVPLIGAEFAGFDGIDWAVPALTLTVPGLLLMLAVLAQLTAGAIWLPVARRWLGAFGMGRRRRKTSA